MLGRLSPLGHLYAVCFTCDAAHLISMKYCLGKFYCGPYQFSITSTYHLSYKLLIAHGCEKSTCNLWLNPLVVIALVWNFVS